MKYIQIITAYLSFLLLRVKGSDYFNLPPPPSPDVVDLTTGYNAWMKQYTGWPDPNEKVHVLMTGGCLPLEEGGSDFFKDAGPSFLKRCKELGIACQCRPVIKPDLWNPPTNSSIMEGSPNDAAWELARLLDEHRRGLINVAGVSIKLTYQDPDLFLEAEELGIPVFLLSAMPPLPDEADYNVPQPTGFIGTDHEFLGRTQARLLKQLRPEGGQFGCVLDWQSTGMQRRRKGFLDEITKDNDRNDRPSWYEVDYPYDNTVKGVFGPCHYMDCMMEGLANPANGVNPDAIIFFLQTPIRDPEFPVWVDRYRDQNITIIVMDALDYLSFLSQGYVDGIVGQVVSEMGKKSAEILKEVGERGVWSEGNQNGYRLPDDHHVKTRLISYNLIPTELDEKYPFEIDENLLGNVTIVGYICFSITAFSVLVCAVWTLYAQNNVVVKAAQPGFLLLLLVGILVMSSTIIPLSFDSGDNDSMSSLFETGICMSVPWLAFTGFSITFAALFSKTWRVNKLFHAQSSFARIQVSVRDVIGPFATIFLANVLVLILWTVIDPLTYSRHVGDGTDFWNREIESFGSCRSDKNTLAFLIPLAVINIAILGIACWQAFEARNLESEFAESKYIGLSVGSLFQAFLTALPILAVVKDEPQAYYLLLVLTIFVLSMGILLLIFLPKIFLARKYAGMTEKQQRMAMISRVHASSKRPGRFWGTSNEESVTGHSGSGEDGSKDIKKVVAMDPVPESDPVVFSSHNFPDPVSHDSTRQPLPSDPISVERQSSKSTENVSRLSGEDE